MVRDQLLEGICNQSTKQNLLKLQILTLQKSVDICRAAEKASIHSQSMGTEAPQVMKVYKTNRAKEPAQKKNAYSVAIYMHQNSRCPAYSNLCNAGQGEGPFWVGAQTRTEELLNKGASSQREASAMLHDHTYITLTHHPLMIKMNMSTG